MGFSELKKNLKKDFAHLPVKKIAVLGNTSTQMLAQAIRGYGYHVGLNLETFEADYDQIELSVFQKSSRLHEYQPEIVLIFQATQKLAKHFYPLSAQQKAMFAESQIEKARAIYDALTSLHSCKVIYSNFPEIDDKVFGNYGPKITFSLISQVRRLNMELTSLSQQCRDLFVNDLSSLYSHYGHIFAHDPKIYVSADMVFSLDFLPVIAKNTVDIILSLSGKSRKCLILDLDNTLWGGTIGDDGLDKIQIGDLGIGKAFSELQLWIKQLQQRGVIIVICSKNEEGTAKEPFVKHPDMILRLDDIALFMANWNNKVDNIKEIQKILNIGFDSMVFLDDNPFERNMVRTHLPEICVPELPEDPAEYLCHLRILNLFDTVSYSETDRSRTTQYQAEEKRSRARKAFIDEDEFLSSIDMTSRIRPFEHFLVPRVAQLTQRTNQFNLRTVRYTEDEVLKMVDSDRYATICFTLEDSFGDNGLVSAVILEKQPDSLFIDTWVMSCRVFGRGLEDLILNEIVALARKSGCRQLTGEYIPTKKNRLVKDLYLRMGFAERAGRWILHTEEYEDRRHFIKML
ncbi:MAG: HAD-IIIC family phosphatase [Thermodesulfobacteriota bacterium]|nr:HAD-IIIC family phosphatase [Thermodesulfobacteriota bacterium]